MVDKVSEQVRKKTMQAVKSTGTKLERDVISELWKNGVRFRRNVTDLKGKPDIAIKKYKIVIFIDSCFWHGCELHFRLPKSNVTYWKTKINRNKKRDLEINEHYIRNGWSVLRIWEHQLSKDFDGTIKKIIEFIDSAKKILSNPAAPTE